MEINTPLQDFSVTMLMDNNMKMPTWLLAYVFITLFVPTVGVAQQNSGWENPFGIPGTNGEITAIARLGEIIIVGGKFSHIGAIPANGIALWNGSRWQPLGEGNKNGVDGNVYSIAVKGDEIYVGGSFTSAGGFPAKNIAVWNRSTHQWNAMKGGVSGAAFPYVAALTVEKNNIYVGGLFTQAGGALVSNIAIWDGEQWKRVGTGTNDAVLAMAMYNDTLYAGGKFSTAGGIESGKIAGLDIGSQQWFGLGSGVLGNSIHAIIANDTALFVGGDFVEAGEKPMKNLAVWHPSSKSWDSIISITNRVGALALQSQDLIIGSTELRRIRSGREVLLDSSAAKIASADGVSSISALHVGANNEIIIGGVFNAVYSARHQSVVDTPFVYAQNLCALHHDSISIFFNGVNGAVHSLASNLGSIYIGGEFTNTGTQKSRNLAVWDSKNQQWESTGLSIAANPKIKEKDAIKSISVIEDRVYASDLGMLWRWQNGDGMKNLTREKNINGGVLLKHNNTLYVANAFGLFSVQNDTQTQIAPIPPSSEGDRYIYSGLSNDKNIYFGGYFSYDTAGKTISKALARWDSEAEKWYSVGGSIDRTVHAIAVDSTGKIIIGGVLKKAGETDVSNIAMWDPATERWSDMGGGANDTVFALMVHNTNIYAAGTFTEIGGVTANRIARWDGKQWHPLGLGIQGGNGVYALAIGDSGYLYAGGEFSSVDGEPAWNLARWNTSSLSSSATITLSPNYLLEVKSIHYGSPRHAIITFANPVRGEAKVELFTILGQKAKTVISHVPHGSNQFPLDLSEIPPGYYFCRISGNGGTTTQRLIITQ